MGRNLEELREYGVAPETAAGAFGEILMEMDAELQPLRQRYGARWAQQEPAILRALGTPEGRQDVAAHGFGGAAEGAFLRSNYRDTDSAPSRDGGGRAPQGAPPDLPPRDPDGRFAETPNMRISERWQRGALPLNGRQAEQLRAEEYGHQRLRGLVSNEHLGLNADGSPKY